MYRWRKDTKHQVKEVEQKRDRDPSGQAPGLTGEAVCYICEHDGCHADGHDPGVGNDMADVLEHLQGG